MEALSSESGPARPELPRAEWIIMQVVWDAVESVSEISVRELLPAVRRKRKWHVSTVKTMAYRLVKKGYLSSRIQGKTCYYRPTVSRDQATRKSVASFSKPRRVHSGRSWQEWEGIRKGTTVCRLIRPTASEGRTLPRICESPANY